MQRKITFRKKNSLRRTSGDRPPHTSSHMYVRTGRLVGHDLTSRHLDLSSIVNTSCWNIYKPLITKSTYLQLHRLLSCYSTAITTTLQNKLLTSPEMNYLRNVERVPTESLSLFEGHYLDVECPWGELSPCDSIVQVTRGVVWVGAGEFCSSCWRQGLYTLVSLQTATGNVNDQLRTGRIIYNCFKVLLQCVSTSRANFLPQPVRS